MVAGGRSAAQTSGKVSGNSSHLGRGARNLPPLRVEWGIGLAFRGGIASLNPRLPLAAKCPL
jgi:hypothetical protein